MRCSNCGAAECRKPRRDRDGKPEVNLTQLNDDEPALLLAKCGEK